MNSEKLGVALVLGAFMIAVSVLGASWAVSQSLDRATNRLAAITLDFKEGAKHTSCKKLPLACFLDVT